MKLLKVRSTSNLIEIIKKKYKKDMYETAEWFKLRQRVMELKQKMEIVVFKYVKMNNYKYNPKEN